MCSLHITYITIELRIALFIRSSNSMRVIIMPSEREQTIVPYLVQKQTNKMARNIATQVKYLKAIYS